MRWFSDGQFASALDLLPRKAAKSIDASANCIQAPWICRAGWEISQEKLFLQNFCISYLNPNQELQAWEEIIKIKEAKAELS